MNRIMLRFRPIAPKPVAGGTVSGGSSGGNREVYVRNGRGRRRYVRDGNSSSKGCSSRKRKASSEETASVSGGETVVSLVTLPLLPETPDLKDSPVRVSPSEKSDLTCSKKQSHNLPIRLNFFNKINDNHESSSAGHVSIGVDQNPVLIRHPARLTGPIVTVECVTDAWVDGYDLGCKDQERMRNLEEDTCPGFISDGSNRVSWTNRAYREMVGDEGGGEAVVMKENVPITCPAFTCRVRLQYASVTVKERRSLTMPCDVWRMDGGGFAWRLDVKAALSLSLGR